VSIVASPALRDVAVAVYDPRHPTIYYNPTLLGSFAPELQRFFLAHEYGHLAFHHTRASALGLGLASRDSLLQARELEADCFAAAQLAAEHREAVNAAVRFFSQMGPMRFDHEHPTGAQRAARILGCLPDRDAGP
jgi:Zn-dependent peptidase ImmA (M78 family)